MDYDVLVLGGGPGGYVAAIRAAQLGGKIGLIEERELGGTCLNRGCIPTKALIESVHALSMAQRGAEFGFTCGDVKPDFPRMWQRKDEVVRRLRKGLRGLLKKNKVDVIPGRGRLTDARSMEVSDGTKTSKVTGRNLIVATGSEPLRIEGFPFDGKTVITSDEALQLERVPDSILIVGGGYIGAEWAGIFARLGTRVTVVEMMEQLLPRSDSDLAAELLKSFKKSGVTVHLKAKVESVNVSNASAACKLSNGENVVAGKVLVSVGRSLNSGDIGLDAAGVTTNRGAIAIDERCRTNVPGVYAIGDVTAKLMLAHLASRQGIVAAECAMGHESRMNYRVVPACVFTDPEIGSVGMTSAECAEAGIEVKEARYSLMGLGKAQAMGEARGFAKIIANAKTGEVLGVHIIGSRAADLIAEAGLAMSLEATVEEIAGAIHAHPTLPEGLMEAAEAWLGRGIHS